MKTAPSGSSERGRRVSPCKRGTEEALDGRICVFQSFMQKLKDFSRLCKEKLAYFPGLWYDTISSLIQEAAEYGRSSDHFWRCIAFVAPPFPMAGPFSVCLAVFHKSNHSLQKKSKDLIFSGKIAKNKFCVCTICGSAPGNRRKASGIQKKNPERVCQKGRPFDTRRKRKEYE